MLERKSGTIEPVAACNHGARDVVLITPEGSVRVKAGLFRGEYTEEVRDAVNKFGEDEVRVIHSKFTYDSLDYGE